MVFGQRDNSPTINTFANLFLTFGHCNSHICGLTLELTGRADTADTDKLTIKDMLTRAPVQ
jgi:hypothetical protein